jgi:hypothetical protein
VVFSLIAVSNSPAFRFILLHTAFRFIALLVMAPVAR